MTVDESRATVGETYGCATRTSNLRVQERRTGVDVIMAAGMVSGSGPSGGHGLGVLLLRLQGEFDSVRGALMQTAAELPKYEAMARAIERKADRMDANQDEAGVVLRSDAAALRRMALGQALTERLLALIEMKTLRESRQALGEYAQWLATKERFMEPPAVVDKLAGRVLDVFLDPTCHTCSGTGQIGSGYQNETMRTCDTCGGSGHRRDSIGNGPRARWFAFVLLGNMQREVAHAAAGIGRKLSSRA